MADRVEIDGIRITVYRAGIFSGFFAEAHDQNGKLLAVTSTYRGEGSRQRAIDAALAMVRTGKLDTGDLGGDDQ